MMRPLRPLCFVALAVTGAAGCLPATEGSLENGGFTYFCASDADLACRDNLLDAAGVPPAIAVGAHFDLKFEPPIFHSAQQPNVTTIESASPDLLLVESSQEVDGTGFRFVAPGEAAVLAKGDGQVVDFIHLSGAAIDHISVADRFGEEVDAVTISGSVGQTLRALPRSAREETLAGALSYAWSTSDEAIVGVSGSSFAPNEADLLPGNPGTATVTVKVQGKVTKSIQVIVGGAP